MINKIKSLTREFEINLSNPLSSHIYALDSINLIIGNNGSGKTRLIKSIIRDLISEESPEEFIAEGSVDKLGIVYYTAAPFHKTMKSSVGENFAFIDASAGQQTKQDFMEAAQEYVAVSRSLEITDDLHSTQYFDLEETALELVSALIPHIAGSRENIASGELNELYREYRELRSQYNRMGRYLREITEVDDLQNFRGHHSLNEKAAQLEALNKDIEYVAKLILEQRARVVNRFMADSGSFDPGKTINWISATCLLKGRILLSARRELARRIYRGNFDNFAKDSTLFKKWTAVHDVVDKFADAIEMTRSGVIRRRAAGLEISVDIARLIQSKIERRVISSAHKHGLVRIGFDQISSGQAAILHQMISVSHAIQELAERGRKNILLFIDEGDLLLHLRWQREYINLVDSRLCRVRKHLGLKAIQVVIATHSPILATDILRGSINRLGEGLRLPSFGAPLQQVVNFSFDSPSIGVVANVQFKD